MSTSKIRVQMQWVIYYWKWNHCFGINKRKGTNHSRINEFKSVSFHQESKVTDSFPSLNIVHHILEMSFSSTVIWQKHPYILIEIISWKDNIKYFHFNYVLSHHFSLIFTSFSLSQLLHRISSHSYIIYIFYSEITPIFTPLRFYELTFSIEVDLNKSNT